jgi:hypothetical protein
MLDDAHVLPICPVFSYLVPTALCIGIGSPSNSSVYQYRQPFQQLCVSVSAALPTALCIGISSPSKSSASRYVRRFEESLSLAAMVEPPQNMLALASPSKLSNRRRNQARSNSDIWFAAYQPASQSNRILNIY